MTSRRELLGGASLALAAGLAQGPAAAQAGDAAVWSAEYWANKGSVKLNLWRKRVGAPRAGEPPLPVLFLVHGSSNSSRSSYDLQVPAAKGTYSMMDVFAREGYDVWTMDHDGYGYSGSSGNNSDIASGVEDLRAMAPLLQRETGLSRWHFFGQSSGAIRAAAYAQAEPQRVGRLVLSAFTYKGTGAPEIGRRAARVDQLRASNRRLRDAAMIRSIFTRDGHASAYDAAVPEAIAAFELKFGDQVPTGTYLDMAANLPLVDPKKVQSPVLMLRGEHDGNGLGSLAPLAGRAGVRGGGRPTSAARRSLSSIHPHPDPLPLRRRGSNTLAPALAGFRNCLGASILTPPGRRRR